MQKWLDEANVRFFPGTFVQRAADRWVRLAGGASLRSDLLVYVPAYQGAPAVRAVPRLTDEDGFVVTDRTMRSPAYPKDRKSTRLNSSHVQISYAGICLKK